MMQNPVITVTVFNTYIKNIIDSETMLSNISLLGEIGGFNISGGNAFFNLKDNNALLNCAFFGFDSSYIPKIGDKVIVCGSPKYYVKGGKLTFSVISIEPFGEGDLFKKFNELKNKLENEGLFSAEHKKSLPDKVDRIGVVTSETGAVIHDIINVAYRRSAGQDIVLYPVKVQGLGAENEIAKAIDYFNKSNVDAVIVCRGGGSEEDLSAFNSEIVARAIYNCDKFVLSAVGHETNFTIADYVADLRAPTPSAAAELLTKDGIERREKLQYIFNLIQNAVTAKLSLKIGELNFLLLNMNNTIDKTISVIQNTLDNYKEKLKSLNPKSILGLGYAKVELNGNMLKDITNVNIKDKINVHFANGSLCAEVKEIIK